MKEETLDAYIHNLLEGTISDQEFDDLQKELRMNPDARESYLDHIAFQNALDIFAQGGNQMDLTSEISLKSPTPKLHPPKSPKQKVAVQVITPTPRIKVFSGLPGFITWAGAALVTLSAAIFFALEYLEQNGFIYGSNLASIQIAPGTSIEIYNEGRFAPSDLIIPNTIHDVSPGDRFRIKKGFVQLDFSNGVRGIVEAPADFTIEHNKHIKLPAGKAWFNVPEAGQGFTVTTQQTKNVDLGTKFGVYAHPHLDDQLTVQEGSVRISSLSKPEVKKIIVAGNSLNCDEEGKLYIAPTTQTFTSVLPRIPEYVHWSFDSLSPEKTLPSKGNLELSSLPKATTTTSLQPRLVSGKHGKAISLSTAGEFVTTEWSGLEGSTDRTVMLWVKLPKSFTPRIIPMPALIQWGTPSNSENSHWKLTIHPRGGAYSPSVSLGATTFHGLANVPQDEWAHIAVVQRGKGKNPFTLYINGEEQSIQVSTANSKQPPINTVTNSPRSEPVSMGGAYYRNKPFTINCIIDDVYILNGAITSSTLSKWMNNDIPKQEELAP